MSAMKVSEVSLVHLERMAKMVIEESEVRRAILVFKVFQGRMVLLVKMDRKGYLAVLEPLVQMVAWELLVLLVKLVKTVKKEKMAQKVLLV